jgi:hypothetical protein
MKVAKKLAEIARYLFSVDYTVSFYIYLLSINDVQSLLQATDSLALEVIDVMIDV